MSWAMRSPSCSQRTQLAREVGALGVVDEQVAQQQGGALDVLAALLEEREDLDVGAGPVQQRHLGDPSPWPDFGQRSSLFFHSRFTVG